MKILRYIIALPFVLALFFVEGIEYLINTKLPLWRHVY